MKTIINKITNWICKVTFYNSIEALATQKRCLLYYKYGIEKDEKEIKKELKAEYRKTRDINSIICSCYR